MSYEQDDFWRGPFGNEYVERNAFNLDKILPAVVAKFTEALKSCGEIRGILEFGSNIGNNLIALRLLLPKVEDISAIEINEKAAKQCEKNVKLKHMYCKSIHEFEPDYQRDYGFIYHRNIHFPGDDLNWFLLEKELDN